MIKSKAIKGDFMLYGIYFFVVGTIMGSFLNVVATRIPQGKSIIKPRSHCEECNHLLRWYDLVPIISFIINRGRCHYCHKKIGISYLLVEVLTGILYLISYLYFGFTYNFIISLVISSVLITIVISDFKYLYILDEPLIIGSILVFITYLFLESVSLAIEQLLSGVLLFLFMYGIKILGDIIFKRESLGGGDIKLSFFIGLVLGYKVSFVCLVVGSLLALPMAFYSVLKKRNREIPFGPFLIMATFICFLFQSNIIDFLDKLIYLY